MIFGFNWHVLLRYEAHSVPERKLVPQFLDHDHLGPAIVQLMSGAAPRCAVAFWGDGASRALFPSGRSPVGARVICDLTMGGSNPKELKALGAPDSDEIKHLRGLHAKVYLSEKGLITCSANASNNGIGFLDVVGLVEAGTFHPPQSEAFQSASDWFERIWLTAGVVDQPALDEAERAWKRRPKLGGRGWRPMNPVSLLDVVASHPQRFRGVGFVFTRGQATREERNAIAEALIERDMARDVELLSPTERKALKAWRVGDVFSEWPPEDISAWPERFVCAHWNSRGRFSYWFYKRDNTIVLEGERGMVLASRPRMLRQALGFGYRADVMADADATLASRIFDHIDEPGHRLFESGEKLAQLLGELRLD